MREIKVTVRTESLPEHFNTGNSDTINVDVTIAVKNSEEVALIPLLSILGASEGFEAVLVDKNGSEVKL